MTVVLAVIGVQVTTACEAIGIVVTVPVGCAVNGLGGAVAVLASIHIGATTSAAGSVLGSIAIGVSVRPNVSAGEATSGIVAISVGQGVRTTANGVRHDLTGLAAGNCICDLGRAIA